MKEQNGGGPYCDLGVHFVDSLLWMCGNPRVLSVSGMSFDCLSHQGKDIMINIKESGAHAGTVFTPRPYDPKEMSVEEAAMGRHPAGRELPRQLQVHVGAELSHLPLLRHLRPRGRH